MDEIRDRLDANPFRPFTIVTSSGERYRVASRDHASIAPKKTRMIIWFDEGGSTLVASLHITAIDEEAPTTQTFGFGPSAS